MTLPRRKQALTRTRLCESVSWTRTPYPVHQKKQKARVWVKKVGETAAVVAALPLTRRLGTAKTPHSREGPRPGENVQFQAALMAPPGLTCKHAHPWGQPRRVSEPPPTWRLLNGLRRGARPAGKGFPPVMLSRDIEAGRGGYPKPRAPGRLRSDPEVPTVTPPAGRWG